MKTKKFILTIIITSAIVLVLNFILGDWHDTLRNIPYFLAYSLGFSLANWLYFANITRLLNWDKKPEKALIISILGAIPVNALIYFVINLFFRVLIHGQDFHKFITQINILEYTFVIMFALVIALFILTNYSFKAVREAELKAEQFKTQIERNKFERLKTQLNPHFLFNSLNVLTALISEAPDQAEEFSIQLSRIYRYVLDKSSEKLISLSDEIEFARNYLNLLAIRFEEGFVYDLPETYPENAKIPPLSLQVLLENAIKHNQISKQVPLHIHIKISDNNLLVSNNINTKTPIGDSPKTGLINLKKRYELLGKNIEIMDSGSEFLVKLPLL